MLQREENYRLDEILHFVYEIYRATKGKYPLLEWVSEKPKPHEFEKFKAIYKPFLKERLENEFDEFYVWRKDGEIISTVAIVYKYRGKKLDWIPDSLMKNENAFIEFLMVSPRYWKQGYGRETLLFALKRINELGKTAFVSTSKTIDAHAFYKKMGFKDVCMHAGFVIMKCDLGMRD